MNWINPPETVRRFSIHQVVQHWAAAAAGLASILTAAVSPLVRSGWPSRIHVAAGLAGAAIFLYHILTFVVIGVRDDIPSDKVAFLPRGASAGSKYDRAERADYLNILAWSAMIVLSGIVLRWPGRLGVPGEGTYYWLRILHAGCGAAWVVHMLTVHVPERWFRADAAFRRAIFAGTVPLNEAEKRAGWIADLAARGDLVPAPEETVPEDSLETRQVRDFLERGNRLTREGEYAAAVEAYREALDLYPQYSQARFNLGVAMMKMGNPDGAREQFRMFVEMDPFNPIAGKAREMIEETSRKRNGEDR